MRKSVLATLPLAALLAGANAAPPAPPPEIAPIPVVLLAEAGSGQPLFARNPDLRFVPASMTKAMTAYVAFGLIASGKLREDKVFPIDPAVAREWSGKGTSLYLKGGDRVTADVLLRGITTVSANDASVALAVGHTGSVAAWTGLMNAEARKLGMTGSHFATPNGFPDQGATYVTARDLVRLGSAMAARYPDLYRRYFGQKQFAWNGLTQLNKDPVTGVIAGADGIKTGHTKEAGYNFLGSAERNGRRLISVVAGAASEAERASASRALLEWGFAAWHARQLFKQGAPIAEAQVQGGDVRRIALISGGAVHASFPKGNPGAISLQLVYKGPLIAPIEKGAKVAELRIITGAGEVGRVPLLAMRAVGKAGPLDRFWNGLAGIFS